MSNKSQPMIMASIAGANGHQSGPSAAAPGIEIEVFDVIDGNAAANVKRALTAAQSKTPITLTINSPGGSVTDAVAMYTLLKSHKGEVTARVVGLAASAATVLMMAADRVVMAKHAMLMIHNPWLVIAGDASDQRAAAELLDKAGAEMVDIYAEKTGQTAKAITEIMAKETWFNADEAVAAGFADAIEEASEKPRMSAAAVAYLSRISQQTSGSIAQARADREKTRVSEINNIFDMLPATGAMAEIKDKAINMSFTTKQTRAAVMASIGAETTPCTIPNSYHRGHVSNGDIIKDGIINALSARVGQKHTAERTPYDHMSLFEMAKASLTESGGSLAGYGSKMQVVGAAFTHTNSDFGNALSYVAEKAMLKGWEESGETWQEWCKRGELSNFRTANRVGLNSFPSLPEVREGAEYKHITLSDTGAPIQLATYGGLFGITRQAIINDDLSLFTSIPQLQGRAASRTIGDLVYSVLTKNHKFVDGKALFHADHMNLIDGLVDLVGLDAARKLMRLQKDHEGQTLNIAPAFMIVPAALESAAISVIGSTALPGADNNSGVMNPLHNLAKIITEPRLDKADPKAWYMAAAQGMDTLEVAFLDGVDTPYLEQQQGWSVDGVSFKVRIDAGVAPLDYRGMLKSTGDFVAVP
ncbi:Clp protease ClpP [Oceanisphaera sediminis]|uniref:ATP-dependent Clp protease proteolytic subunit n=1 Tax=Oceanisphaera sediminis TaxID=981381 RepID=A0ABP7D552_9GAMM